MLASIISIAATLATSSLALAAFANPPLAKGPFAVRFIALEAPMHSSVGQSALDLGTMRAQSSRWRTPAITIRKRVGVRLEGVPALARVSVSLVTEPLDAIVMVDGRRLSTAPLLIDAARRVGATVAHEIELTIPAHAPPGLFLAGIVWHAETP